MQTASSESDCYDNISVLSTYWASDDTGSKEDTTLFLDTISKLENVETHKRVLADDDEVFSLRDEIANQAKSTIAGNRQLFILHYAGHAVATSTSSRLVITPKIAHGEFVGPQLNMTLVKDALKDLATTSPGLDILLVMGCFTSLAESTRVEGARVELLHSRIPVKDGMNPRSRRNGVQLLPSFGRLECPSPPTTSSTV